MGGTFSGSGDDARVPTRGAMAGVVLQAMTVETILSKYPVRGIGDIGRGIGDIGAIVATGTA